MNNTDNINKRKINAQKEGRGALMLLWLGTIINILWNITQGQEIVFSSCAVFSLLFLGLIGGMLLGMDWLIVCWTFAFLVLLMYFLCWLFARRNYRWFIVGFVLSAVDTVWLLVNFIIFAIEGTNTLYFGVITHFLLSALILYGFIECRKENKKDLPIDSENLFESPLE